MDRRSFNELRGESFTPTSGTRITRNKLPGASRIRVEGAATYRVGFGARIHQLLHYDDSAGTYTALANAQDKDTNTVVTLSSFAVEDFIYIGVKNIANLGGIWVDVVQPNGDNSVMTAAYYKNDDTWAALTITDGTVSTGKTLAVDGEITWTPPTDAKFHAAVTGFGPLYWIRLDVSVVLDTNVTVAEIVPLPGVASTSYAIPNSGNTPLEVELGNDVGSISLDSPSGSPQIDITWFL